MHRWRNGNCNVRGTPVSKIVVLRVKAVFELFVLPRIFIKPDDLLITIGRDR